MVKVDAYLNLHKDCVSIRSRETEDYGKVVAHRQKVHVADAEFVVQPSGRERAREQGVKNVHAFVRGEWDDSGKVTVADAKVDYDPFGVGEFYEKESGRVVEACDKCAVTRSGVLAKGLTYANPNIES